MGLFGKSVAEKAMSALRDIEDIEPTENDRQKAARQVAEAHALAEKDALAKRDDLLAEYIAAYEADRAAYQFECRRWGDFLNLNIRRLMPVWVGDGGWSVQTYATAVNLRDSRTVRLVEGGPPDCKHKLIYRLRIVTDAGAGALGWYGKNMGRVPVPPGHRYVASPMYTLAADGRKMFELDSKRDDVHYPTFGCGVRPVTENYPRPARDDVIRFEGPDASLYAPAGMGQGVLDAILREIAAGIK